ncbi:hypothetical protein BCV69DRAFT_253923, partial [Microstroma glucosiphilum]
MVGLAGDWYSQQSLHTRQNKLNTWEGWIKGLHTVFQGDIAKKEATAIARKWEYRTETSARFFFEKNRLMKAVYPDRSPASLARDIWRGLPETYQGMIREHLKPSPNLDLMLEEMNAFENAWR